jgi:hypothetical protein
MVIMYSGTEWESQWRPRSAQAVGRAVLMRRETTCSPCFAFNCPYNMECLDFDPEAVVAEAITLLTMMPPGISEPRRAISAELLAATPRS